MMKICRQRYLGTVGFSPNRHVTPSPFPSELRCLRQAPTRFCREFVHSDFNISSFLKEKRRIWDKRDRLVRDS